jgi:hypothetical protein
MHYHHCLHHHKDNVPHKANNCHAKEVAPSYAVAASTLLLAPSVDIVMLIADSVASCIHVAFPNMRHMK